MSEKTNSKFKISFGEFEMEIEGKEDFIISIIGENVFDFIENALSISRKTVDIKGAKINDEFKEKEKKDEGEVPQLIGTKGLTDAIRTLFKTTWSKNPHNMSEIKDVLELNALHFDTTQIGSALSKLIKSGDLRRMGTRGNYQYLHK